MHRTFESQVMVWADDRRRLLHEVERLEPERLTAKPLPGKWSILEIVLLEVVTSGALLQWVPDPLELRTHALPPDFAEARARAEHRLKHLADRLHTDGAKHVTVRVVEDLGPAAAITRVAREEGADFIAMSTRGAGGLERFVLGSVAEAVVRDSDVPVLLVKPRDG